MRLGKGKETENKWTVFVGKTMSKGAVGQVGRGKA